MINLYGSFLFVFILNYSDYRTAEKYGFGRIFKLLSSQFKSYMIINFIVRSKLVSKNIFLFLSQVFKQNKSQHKLYLKLLNVKYELRFNSLNMFWNIANNFL